MNPPTMAGWNLGLRFGLEIAALAGIGAAAWRFADGSWRWVAVVAAPLVAAVVWGVFNVPGDPSRSGAAPVQVPGGVRLALELGVLAAGSAGFLLRGERLIGVGLSVLVVVHYVASVRRLEWLLEV